MKSLSVIVVNHNTKRLCEQAVTAVKRTTHAIDIEVIVVDNSYKAEELYNSTQEHVTVIVVQKNMGFGHACNVGAQKSTGAFLLFLNPDTVVEDGALDSAYEYIKSHSYIGALGIRTVLQDGSFDHGCMRGFPTPMSSIFYFTGIDRLFPRSKWVGGYRLTYLDNRQTHDVDSVSGSFLMMPRDIFFSVGGFDEIFFMYGEDLDLCYRIKQKGLRIIYFSEAQMLHLKGQSGMHTRDTATLYHFYNAMLLFYDKHYKPKYSFAVTSIIHLAIKFKYRFAMRKTKAN